MERDIIEQSRDITLDSLSVWYYVWFLVALISFKVKCFLILNLKKAPKCILLVSCTIVLF